MEKEKVPVLVVTMEDGNSYKVDVAKGSNVLGVLAFLRLYIEECEKQYKEQIADSFEDGTELF